MDERMTRLEEFEEMVEVALNGVARTVYGSVAERLDRCSVLLNEMEAELDEFLLQKTPN